jgi:lipopolysaccharide/colanic/teichoic acid biosynthesis glycosyltransferase
MVYRDFFKPVIDRILAAIGLLVLAPVLLVIAVAVRVKMGGPVIFHQLRPGRNGQIFGFKKFRSMTQERDGDGNLLPDELRLTPFGRFLRSSSLDELPQLFNVLAGDMSLIGPRPLLPEYLPRYSALQFRRHEVAPGITGWAQIKGRNAISWDEKFRLDVWYVDNLSFPLDCRILLQTVWAVVGRRGISRQGHATMPVFMGSETPEASS